MAIIGVYEARTKFGAYREFCVRLNRYFLHFRVLLQVHRSR